MEVRIVCRNFLDKITLTENCYCKISLVNVKTFNEVINMLNITDEKDIQALKAANPKAAKAGKFDDDNSIYIPKQLAARIQLEKTFNL